MRYITAVFLSVTLLFASSIHGQDDQNTVQYTLRAAVNTDYGTVHATIDTGVLPEGEPLVLPEKDLSGSGFESIQSPYSAISGGTFTLDDGAIDEDLELVLTLGPFQQGGSGYVPVYDTPLFFNLEVDVYQMPGRVAHTEDYYFNPGKYVRMQIPKDSAFTAFIDQRDISTDSLLFAYIDIEGFSEDEIETVDTDQYLAFRARHFSSFVGLEKSVETIPTGMASSSGESIPESPVLNQNYPNPFNPETQISYYLPRDSYVEITVYNALGEQVRTLHTGQKASGRHTVRFDGKGFSSGIYLYELQTDAEVILKKMLLVK